MESAPLREITELNTQVRLLSVISHLVKILSAESIPEIILKRNLIQWSLDLETSHEEYRFRTGKLTRAAKPTTAFPRYLSFAKALGLVSTVGGTYRRSRLGSPLSLLLAEGDGTSVELSTKEKLFFLLVLLWKDADPILSLLDRVWLDETRGTSQVDLQNEFQDLYLVRLQTKIKQSSDERARHSFLARLSVIKSEWKNPTKYAEHIVPPRLEWLKDLGILDLAHEKGKTYRFSKRACDIYLSLPRLTAEVTDVSDEWLWGSFMGKLGCHLFDKPFRLWGELDDDERKRQLLPFLERAFEGFATQGVPRISLVPGLVYIAIRLAVDRSLISDFRELESWLAAKQTLNNRQYEVRISPRENESYILALSS